MRDVTRRQSSSTASNSDELSRHGRLTKTLLAIAITFAGMLTGAEAASAAAFPTATPPLERAYASKRMFGAITVSDDGRRFISFPGQDTQPGAEPSVIELDKNGTSHAYPDAAWNDWRHSSDKANAFVNVNTLRVGPDGNLWIVDSGDITGPAKAKPKLVVIDLARNNVIRTSPLDGGATPLSHVDDLRFHGDWLYLSDTSDPAVIVVNQKTGLQRRVLAHTKFTTGTRPLYVAGKVVMADGKPIHVHTDQLETSPDGKLLYFQGAAGPLYVVPTAALDDTKLPEKELEKQVRLFLDTPSTGGTAIAGDGVIYLTDINTSKILKITPDAHVTTLIADPRLHWADGMWIDATGKLWIPVLQLDRTAPFQTDGKSHVALPLEIYTMDLHLTPAR
jgi:hypothetical protein